MQKKSVPVEGKWANGSLQSVCPDVNACTSALAYDLHVSMSK